MAALILYLGWRYFWFLTDDAYIAFRYISNSRLGFGYVWNAPPFRPVEGYTSFLWVVLLDGIWRVFGVDPPHAANTLALLFSYGTLALGAVLVLNMRLSSELDRWRWLFLALVFAGTLTNRTFLAWTSSGLETALFNFCFTFWVFLCLTAPERLWAIAAAAALVELTRPDGLLVVAATLALLAEAWWRRRAPRRRVLLSALPIAATLAHVLWRRSFYGEWVPNTYFAKHVAAWPEAGRRYLESFVLEYALWIWAAVIAGALVACMRRRGWWRDRKIASDVAIAVLIAHAGYYTFIIGGDHFEYRVYSHLILLLFIAFLWALDRLNARWWAAAGAFVLFIAASWPIPWIHWELTFHIPRGAPTWRLRRPVAPHLPAFARGYGRKFDELQDWLILHYDCMRHEEHRNFLFSREDMYAPRSIGEKTPGKGYPVIVGNAIGYMAWVLPHVNVIDQLGLNDWVIAHTPIHHAERTMAHDRAPPAGYVECFEPNVTLLRDRVVVSPRTKPLTADRIRQCEATFAAAVTRHR